MIDKSKPLQETEYSFAQFVTPSLSQVKSEEETAFEVADKISDALMVEVRKQFAALGINNTTK